MGKASSAKKIARAERAGATTGPSERREIGFPALVIAIIIVGLGLVVWARTTRDAQPSPTLQDHWHSAYSIYDCASDSFLEPFQSEFDPEGIHSHGDSLIHIHPFSDGVTGKKAVMRIFLEAMGATISPERLGLPGDQGLDAGVECNGEPAVIQVARWSDAFSGGPPTEIITDDMADIRFLNDGEGYTIARAPLGAEIPGPNSLEALAAVIGQGRGEGVEPPNSSNPPGPQDFGVDLDEALQE